MALETWSDTEPGISGWYWMRWLEEPDFAFIVEFQEGMLLSTGFKAREAAECLGFAEWKGPLYSDS